MLRFRELFLHLFRRDLQVRYRGSALGLLWTLINPLVLMGAYTLVFSILLKAESDRVLPAVRADRPAAVGVLQASLQTATTTLVGHSNLVKQVRFPRQLLAFSVVGTNLVTLFAMLIVILPVHARAASRRRARRSGRRCRCFFHSSRSPAGLALVVACANVLFRDVEHIVAAVLLPWFFLTPIF